MTHLVGNAIKFTNQNGSVKVSAIPVTDSISEQVKQIKFSVKDTGIGISEED